MIRPMMTMMMSVMIFHQMDEMMTRVMTIKMR